MHAFRAETGTTLRRYPAAAARRGRAAIGSRQATAIWPGSPWSCGFASHAHLTDTLSRLIGVAPRQVRAELASADRGWVRSFLEAGAADRL